MVVGVGAGAVNNQPQLRLINAYWMMSIVSPSTSVSAELNVALASGRERHLFFFLLLMLQT